MEYSILMRPDLFEDHKKSVAKEIKKVVKRRKVPADTKLALYRQENYRRRILKEKGTELNVKPKRSKVMISEGIQSDSPTEFESIVDTLPKSLRPKGGNFIKFLHNIPNFKVNEKGEISYGGQHIHGSRIFDLVHDFLRYRPSKSPAKGWQVLAEALKDNNVPREFIGNQSRWHYIQALEKSELDSSFTPVATSTPRQKSLSDTLSELQSLRKRLQSQTGSGISKALKLLKWRTY